MNLEEIVEEFLDRHRKGGSPSMDEYVRRFPNLESDIRATLPALVLVENHKEEAQLGNHEGGQAYRPQEVGDYRVIAEIGRGGMGVVYEAEQKSLGRRVALKLLPPSLNLDEKVRKRFYREAQAAARMHHGNIVPVFEVGEDNGQFFYAMQRIDGCGLDEVINAIQRIHSDDKAINGHSNESRPHKLASAMLSDRFQPRRLGDSTSGSTVNMSDSTSPEIPRPGNATPIEPVSTRPLADLVGYHRCVAHLGLQAAEALDYAHSRGVIHRDIKPSNLILDASGVIWVSDFGLAKAEDDGLTQSGELLGTVRYMSPERFRGECKSSADIYSLGLTLYELLALRPAFDGGDRVEVMNLISGTEPQRLRVIDRKIPKDLASIVSKAIEKDPRRRYASAAAMAEDLHRYLMDQPISARPISILERGVRWTQGNRSLAGLIFTIAALIVMIAVVSPIALLRESALRSDAEQARTLANRRAAQIKRNLYFAEMNLAGQAINEPGGIGQVRELLANWQSQTQINEDLRGWEWHFLKALSNRADGVFEGPIETVWSVDFSPDGRWVVAVANDGKLNIWDRVTGEYKHRIRTRANAGVDWSPDGSRLAATTRKGELVIWNAATLQEIQTIGVGPAANRRSRRPVQWSPDGKKVVWLDRENNLTVWDVAEGREVCVRQINAPSIRAVAWSPHSDQIVFSNGDRIELFKLGNGKSIWVVRQQEDQVQGIAWSPDATKIATAGYQGKIVIRDSVDGGQMGSWNATDGAVWALSWAPANNRLASAHADRMVRVWDVGRGRPVQELHGHTDRVLAVQWSQDGKYLVSGGEDLGVRVWNADSTNRTMRLYNDSSSILSIDWNPDGTRLAAGTDTGQVDIYEPSNPAARLTLQPAMSESFREAAVYALSWSPDGERVAWAQHDGSAHVWTESAKIKIEAHGARIWSLDWHPDSSRIATGGADGFVYVWDALSGAPMQSFECGTDVLAVHWSPDGRFIATAEGNQIKVRSVDRGTVLFTFDCQRPVRSICFNPDGTKLATASRDLAVRILDVETGQQVGDVLQATGTVTSLHWSPDPDRPRLAGASPNGTVRIWDTSTGKLALSLATPEGPSTSVRWSFDGRRLAAVGGDTIYVWDATTSYREQSSE